MSILKSITRFMLGQEEEAQKPDVSRNDPCWCGSGIKYKKCHLGADEEKARRKAQLNCGRT